jgi:Na+:H+ antiporter, NhaA family
MLIGLTIALAWSISGHRSYVTITQGNFTKHLSSWGLNSLHGVTLNLLLTFFFLAIGIELARESQSGTLKSWPTIASPLFGALGGMVFTAIPLLVVGLVTNTHFLIHGWGIPMATDIALTLGTLSLLGSRVPASLRLFVLTLAVLDDIGSIVALGFVHPLRLSQWLVALVAVIFAIGAVLLWRKGNQIAMWLALISTWIAFQRLGVEPALAGAVIGVLAVNSRTTVHLERRLSVLSSYTILPLFALVATGITLNSQVLTRKSLLVLLTISLVRLIGKALGISVGVRLSAAFGASRPAELRGLALTGTGLLCAIGFTVPLVFTSAVTKIGSANYNAVTVGLLAASIVGGAAGLLLVQRGLKRHLNQRGN